MAEKKESFPDLRDNLYRPLPHALRSMLYAPCPLLLAHSLPLVAELASE